MSPKAQDGARFRSIAARRKLMSAILRGAAPDFVNFKKFGMQQPRHFLSGFW